MTRCTVPRSSNFEQRRVYTGASCMQGYRTGYPFHESLVRKMEKHDRVNAEVEVPPTLTSVAFQDDDGSVSCFCSFCTNLFFDTSEFCIMRN